MSILWYLQARIEEIGQSLLRSAHDRDNSTLSMISSKRRKSSRTEDSYEEHFILQEDRVLVLTNCAMVCLLAPGFAAIHAAAEEGRLDSAGAPEIPSSEIRWAVLWKVDLCSNISIRCQVHKGLERPILPGSAVETLQLVILCKHPL